MSKLEVEAEGKTHAGHLRSENEDVPCVEPELGLFGVFDGMGGHMAGDVAAEAARSLVVERMSSRGDQPAEEALKEALESASKAIFEQAESRRDRHGMGTTAVLALIEGTRATVAHVGDSRAYLLRGARLKQLTDDHTVVGSMLAAGAITPEEALHHPYKNVLSRCIGARGDIEVDIQLVDLEPGDRLLFCSDGLCGYASHEAIEQVLRGAEEPAAAANDLVETALRGGGGDNVTVVAVFAGKAAVPQATVILRESGAIEWWRRRELFLEEARKLGVAESPICSNLSPDEAVELVAGNLCEAIFHDLEQTTGIHCWTYAENLAAGWIDSGGAYEALRDLMDLLRDACTAVVADIAAANASFAAVLEVEVTRALIVTESAIAGVIADRIRQLESRAVSTIEETFRPRVNTEQPTVPYLGGPRTNPPSAEVVACLEAVLAQTREAADGDMAAMTVRLCIDKAHELAVRSSGGVEVLDAARELYGEHEQGTMPVFEALDAARGAHLQLTKVSKAGVPDKAEALRRIGLAYQSLAHGVCVLVVDAGRPITDQLKEMAEHTGRMRARVRRGEVKIAELEAAIQGPTVIEGS